MTIEAIEAPTELEQAFETVNAALTAHFPKCDVSVSQSRSRWGVKEPHNIWSITGFAPTHFSGSGDTLEAAIIDAIKKGRIANAKRCPICDGFVGKCGH